MQRNLSMSIIAQTGGCFTSRTWRKIRLRTIGRD